MWGWRLGPPPGWSRKRRWSAVGTLIAWSTAPPPSGPDDRDWQAARQGCIDRANLIAADPGNQGGALKMAASYGLIAVDVMRGVRIRARYVEQAAEVGRGGDRRGRWTAWIAGHARRNAAALIPILRDARGIGIVLQKWTEKVAPARCRRRSNIRGGRAVAGCRALRMWTTTL